MCASVGTLVPWLVCGNERRTFRVCSLSTLFLMQGLCGGLTEVGPTVWTSEYWPPGGGCLGRLRRRGLAGGTITEGRPRASKPTISSLLTLLPVCGWRCDLLPSVPGTCLPHFPGVIVTMNTYLSEAMRPNKTFLPCLALSWCFSTAILKDRS